MNLAKPALDIGLFTTRPDAHRAFWEGELGLAFNHVLPMGPGHKQHRFDLPGGSVLKVNAVSELTRSPPSGYRRLVIIREGLAEPVNLADPDGNEVTLAAPGYLGMSQIGVIMGVRNRARCRAFYGKVLGLAPGRPADSFRVGESLIQLTPDPDAVRDVAIRGPGYRYTTLQVFDCEAEHEAVLARGGTQGARPFRAGDVAIFSMVRDPDGNWIELSQRASIVGALR